MPTLNISSGSDDLRARELSNLTIRPFDLDGVRARSVEGLLQGIKFPPGDPRREEAFGMAGIKAKNMGKQAENQCVWWNGVQIVYGSAEHHALLERAIRASFEQNPIAMLILHSTRGMELIHDLGTPESPRTSLPAADFCGMLIRLRDEVDPLADRRRAEQLGFTPRISLADAQAAAKLIEVDGVEAYRIACGRYGRETAFLLLVCFYRHGFGSMNSYPPDPAIDGKVEQLLRASNIPVE